MLGYRESALPVELDALCIGCPDLQLHHPDTGYDARPAELVQQGGSDAHAPESGIDRQKGNGCPAPIEAGAAQCADHPAGEVGGHELPLGPLCEEELDDLRGEVVVEVEV